MITEKQKEYKHNWARANPEKVANANQRWKLLNLKKVAENARRYRRENKVKRVEYNRKWSLENRERLAKTKHEWYIKNSKRYTDRYYELAIRLKGEMLLEYGRKCKVCDSEANLELDHVNNLGGQERKESGIGSGWTFYQRLKKQGWPRRNLQVLCSKCNIKKYYAYKKLDKEK